MIHTDGAEAPVSSNRESHTSVDGLETTSGWSRQWDKPIVRCESKNIPVFVLAPELQTYAELNEVFLHGFGEKLGSGHWNVAGHRVAGEFLAQKICAAGLLK